MRLRKCAAMLLVVVATSVSACFGGSDAAPDVPDVPAAEESGRKDESSGDEPGVGESVRSLRDVARQAESVLDGLRQRAEEPIAEPIDFRRLRDLLPEVLVGLDRMDARGEKRQLMGALGISEASATYRQAGADGASGIITVEIQDLGGMTSFSALGVTWLLTSVDAETSTGFKRNREVGGHPGYQEFDRASGYGRGRIEVFVADRFLVKVDGQRVEADVLERAVGELDLAALALLRNEGREAA